MKGDPTAFTYYSTVDTDFKLSATTTTSSSDLTNVTNANKIVGVGDLITGPGIPPATIVASVTSTTIGMSTSATASATTTITITPKAYPSVYSFNYGFIHFIGLNSNIVPPFSGTAEQIDFLRKDMAQAINQKRWVIVMMHEAPYTITSSAILRPFINVFDEIGVDLVLCGHHHCYSRSNKCAGIPTLLHLDTSLADSALKTWTATGGAAVSTVLKKFGAGSLLLDGVNDFLSTPASADFNFANYDFTIDFCVYCSPQGKVDATLLANGATVNDATARYIKINAAGNVVVGFQPALTSTSVVTNATWHHVALTRKAGTLRLYIDGVREASAAIAETVDFSLGGTFIGTNKITAQIPTSWFAGNIDEFRAVKKIAKWSTDTTFQTPSAAYGASDNDTVLQDSDVAIPGFYNFMSQATGYKMDGKTAPAATAPYRAEYDRGVADPCYAILEISYSQIAIKPYRLSNVMPPDDNVGKTPVAVSYHPFTFSKT